MSCWQKFVNFKQTMDEKTEEDVRDRISDLPDFIMHQIMSLLTRKEAAQMCVLSKRWNNIWDSFPIFDYDRSCYAKAEQDLISHITKTDEHITEVDKFVNMVDRSLERFQKYDLQMQKLKLHMHFFDGLASMIDKWIALALEKDVKNLNLCLPPIQNCYPGEIYLATLLNGCKLEKPFSNNTRKSYSLENLSLCQVELSETSILNLLQNCPYIVDLNICHCWGFRKIEVSGLALLKSVVLVGMDELEKVDIDAPSLQYFSLSSYSPSSENASYTFNLSACKNLLALHLENVNITDQSVCYYLSAFPVLETLHLSGCSMLERVQVFSNQLKSFRLQYCEKVVEVEIDAPGLLSFAYDGITAPSVLLRNVPCHSQIHFSFNDTDCYDNIWLSNLKEFFRLPTERKDLVLYFSRQEVTLGNIRELREILQSSHCVLDNLILRVEDSYRVTWCHFEALVNSMLAICHPKNVMIHFDVAVHTNGFIEMILELLFNLKREDECSCSDTVFHSPKIKDIEKYEVKDCPSNYILYSSHIPRNILHFALEW